MLNNIVLVGRLTKDPEIRELDNGIKIVSFSLAFSQGKENTEFVDCVVREHLHPAVEENLVKGDKIAISGQFSNRKFQDKNGATRSQARIFVDNIEFVDILKFSEEKEEEKPAPTPVPEKATSRRR